MKNLKLLVLGILILMCNCAISQFKAGYLDKTGKEVIAAQFESASSFHEGLAAVKINGKWGFIDKTGKIVIEPIYGYALDFKKYENQVAAVVKINEDYKFINELGIEIEEPFIAIDVNELRPYKLDVYKWGYKNKSGKIVVPAIYSLTQPFEAGHGIVINNELKSGLVDATGKIAIPLTDFMPIYSEGVFIVNRNGYFEILDDKLASLVVLNKIPNVQQCEKFINGNAPIRTNDKWGLINKKGEIVLEPQYENCIVFFDGVAKAEKNGIIGLINIKGEPIGNIRDERYWGFSEGLSIYTPMNQSGRKLHGFIDKTGTIVVPVKYTNLESFSEGFAVFEKNMEKPEATSVASTLGKSNSNTISTLSAINSDGTNQGDVQHKNRELVYIVNDAGQWTSAKLNQESTAIEAMLKSGLYSEFDFNKISNRASETTYPVALSTYMLREKNMPLARNYACIRIAQFTTSYAPYSVLWIPKADNMNMPDQMQPTSDNGFYIVEKTSSVSTTKNPTSENQVKGLEAGVPISGTTSSGIQYSSYALDIFNNLGCMAIYVGDTMYVVLVKGKDLGNVDVVSARAAAKVGVTNFKYQWFSGSSCETLKNKYRQTFNVRCGYELSLD